MAAATSGLPAWQTVYWYRAPPPGRDYERDPALSEATIRWAAINTMTRRIARGGPATRQRRRELATAS